MNPYTIPGFEKLTKQQLFDMAAAHVLANGKPSMKGGGSAGCAYSGIGCAAAPFLTEEGRQVGDTSRGGSWHSFTNGNSDRISRHEAEFITLLQQAHDNHAVHTEMGHYAVEEWRKNYVTRMDEIAAHFMLNADVLKRGWKS